MIAALGPFVNLAILPVRGGNGLLPLFFFLYSQSTNEPSYQKSGWYVDKCDQTTVNGILSANPTPAPDLS